MKSPLFEDFCQVLIQKEYCQEFRRFAEKSVETSALSVHFDKLGSQHACRSYFSRERPSMLSLSGKMMKEARLARSVGHCCWPLRADQ
jgi:hypothetical protein